MILDKAEASQFFERRKHIWGVAPARAQDGKTINSPRLLRGCGKWGHCARCPEQRDERAPQDHSITSSARASSIGGMSRPMAFAVARLITRSNFVAISTGKSAGFAPLRIRPT